MAPGLSSVVDIGARIRELRARRGMAATDLANAADMHRSHLARIEGGKVPNLPISRLGPIAAALGISVLVLVGAEPMPDGPPEIVQPPEPRRFVLDFVVARDGRSCWLVELSHHGHVLGYEVQSFNCSGFPAFYRHVPDRTTAWETFRANRAGL